VSASLVQIRAAIKATLSAVPSIGIVHDRQRYAKRESDLKAFYQSGDLLLGWHIRRISTTVYSRGMGGQTTHHRWRIFGIRGFEDADSSEIGFDALIEAVRAAFAEADTLGGLVDTCITREPMAQAGLALVDSGPVVFAGILCHGAELSLNTLNHD